MAVKKRRRIKKIFVIILVLIGILILMFLLGSKFLYKGNSNPEKVKVNDKIDEYGYVLKDNETKYYKKIFNNLKNELSNETVDEEEYAKLIAQLFVIDFFNLDNKENKNDVGGTQFVYASFQSDFEKLAKESIYKSIENDIYDSRNQELPIVKNTEVINVEKISYDYLDNSDKEAYEVTLEIEYKEDFGYQTECTIILVHSNNKLEIVKMI